jgi:hypothetical protein
MGVIKVQDLLLLLKVCLLCVGEIKTFSLTMYNKKFEIIEGIQEGIKLEKNRPFLLP